MQKLRGHYFLRLNSGSVRGVVELAGEAVQRLVAEDVDCVAVVLVSRRLHIDGALVAAQLPAGGPVPDQHFSEGLVAGLRRILGQHPGDRAADRALLRDRLDRLGGAACCRRSSQAKDLSDSAHEPMSLARITSGPGSMRTLLRRAACSDRLERCAVRTGG